MKKETKLLPHSKRMNGIDLATAFETLPSVGNQHNVFLATITVAAYRTLRKSGFQKDYTLDLMGELGWQRPPCGLVGYL